MAMLQRDAELDLRWEACSHPPAAASPPSFIDHKPPGEGLPAPCAAPAPRTTHSSSSSRACLVGDGVKAVTFLLEACLCSNTQFPTQA